MLLIVAKNRRNSLAENEENKTVSSYQAENAWHLVQEFKRISTFDNNPYGGPQVWTRNPVLPEILAHQSDPIIRVWGGTNIRHGRGNGPATL